MSNVFEIIFTPSFLTRINKFGSIFSLISVKPSPILNILANVNSVLLCFLCAVFSDIQDLLRYTFAFFSLRDRSVLMLNRLRLLY